MVRSDESLWKHWKPVGRRGNNSMECLYCGHKLQKHAPKCRRHTDQCPERRQPDVKPVATDGEDISARESQLPVKTFSGKRLGKLPDDIWHHWRHVSGSGDKAVMGCMYCGHKLQKHAPKCRQHVIKCKKCPQDIRQSVLDSVAVKPEGQTPSQTTGLWRHWEHTERSGDQWTIACRYCGNRHEKHSGKCRRHTLLCVKTPKEVLQELTRETTSAAKPVPPVDIWQHWKPVTAGCSKNSGVECRFCGNRQLRNSAKCRRHTYICGECPEEIKQTLYYEGTKPTARKTMDVWRHWKHVSGSGSKSIVQCMYCGHKQQKHAPKCRQHLWKCPKCPTNVMGSDMESSDDGSDSCGGGPDLGGDSESGTNQPIEPIVPKYRPQVYETVDIWRHWKHVSGSGAKSIVECMYCGHKLQKHAPKCRRHLMKCPKNVKNMDNSDTDSCGGSSAFGGDSDSGADQPIEPIVRQYRPRVFTPVDIWRHWKHVSGSGATAVMQCMYCGNKQQKHAPKCRRHLMKCPKNPKNMDNSDNDLDSCGGGPDFGGDSDSGADQPIEPIVRQYRSRVCKSVDIHDLLDELSDENKRLLDELKFAQKYIEFMQNYRKCVLVYKRKCVCIQTIDHKPIVQRLETSYEDIKTQISRSRNAGAKSADVEEEVTERKKNRPLIAFINTFNPSVDLDDSQKVATDDDQQSVGDDFGADDNIDSGSDYNFDPFVDPKDKKKIHACDWKGCQYRTAKAYRLVSHKRKEHTNERPFECDKCHRKYSDREYFREHLAIHAMNEETETTLGNRFGDSGDTSRSVDERSQRQQQQNDGLFDYIRVIGRILCQWDECGMTFRKPSEMWRHYRIKHTTIRPYKCPQCPKAYAFLKDLTIHEPVCLRIGAPEGNTVDDQSAGDTAKQSHECCINDCELVFDDKESLDRHMRDDHKYRPVTREDIKKGIRCNWPDCDHTFTLYRELEMHRFKEHTKNKAYVCSDCGTPFPIEKYLKQHQRDSCFAVITRHRKRQATPTEDTDDHQLSPSKVKCRPQTAGANEQVLYCQYPDCGHACDTPSELRTHIDAQHIVEKPFKCQKCGKSFAVGYYLRKHMIRNHYKVGSLAGGYGSDEGADGDYIYKYACDWADCGRRFKRIYELQRHYLTVHNCKKPFKCHKCDKRFQKRNYLSKHKSIYHSGTGAPKMPYQCAYEDCGQVFDQRFKLVAHTNREHTLELPFACDQCSRRFSMQSYLSRHMSRIHYRKYPCESCGQEFDSRPELNVHYTDNADHLQHPCEQCDKRCATRNGLLRHIRQHHLQEREHKCPELGCDAQFITAERLRQHALTHAPEAERRTHLCEWPGCDRAFITSSSLTYHRLIHTDVRDFRCEYPDCGKAFRQKGSLDKHKQMHQMVKRFSCCWPACDQTFSQSFQIDVHVCQHLGLRPYRCHLDGCDSQYASSNYLRKHLRVKHSITDYKIKTVTTEAAKQFVTINKMIK